MLKQLLYHTKECLGLGNIEITTNRFRYLFELMPLFVFSAN